MTTHRDDLESAKRLAHDEAYLVERYNVEYESWHSVGECEELYRATLDTVDLLRENAIASLNDDQGSRDRDLSAEHDEYLARMTALGVVRSDLGCPESNG